MSSWYRSNQAIGVVLSVLLAILLAYIWTRPWAHREMRDGFLLGFFPMLGVVAMLFCTLAMTIDPLRNEVPEEFEGYRLLDVATALAMVVGVGIYFAVMRQIGFVLVTPVFLFLYMAWFGVRPIRMNVILSVTIPIATYILFSVLGVRLPNGILPALF
jgi:hypothetical protein